MIKKKYKNLFDNPQDQRQAYDFFANNKVNNDNLLLVIQDSTYLNFTSHKAKIDIGRIGTKEIPKIEPSIKEVVLLIARLSRYKYTKHSAPPSIKTMWTALKIFYPITQMFYLMSTKT